MSTEEQNLTTELVNIALGIADVVADGDPTDSLDSLTEGYREARYELDAMIAEREGAEEYEAALQFLTERGVPTDMGTPYQVILLARAIRADES